MTPVHTTGSSSARTCLHVLVLLAGLLLGCVASAQERTAPAKAAVSSPSGPSWSSLTSSQREALAPLERDWPTLDGLRKTKWLEVAARFPKMSETEQQRIQQRMREWVRLSPAERNRARLQFNEARQLSNQERQAQWEAYQALPDEKRQALASRAPSAVRPPQAAATAASAAAGPTPPSSAKRNLVAAPRVPPSPRPVRPAVVQPKPGATTTLLTQPAAPPLHQQVGLPKISATEGFVNPTTLLPERGPQGAAVTRSSAVWSSEPTPALAPPPSPEAAASAAPAAASAPSTADPAPGAASAPAAATQ